MEKVSKHFVLNKKQSDLDFLDSKMNSDTELFINPQLFHNSSNSLFQDNAKKKSGITSSIYLVYIKKGRRRRLLVYFNILKK